MGNRILVIAGDRAIRESLARLIRESGLEGADAGDGLCGVRLAAGWPPDLILCDLEAAGLNGLEVLDHFQRARPGMPVILLAEHPSVETAIAAFRQGAWDYIGAPFDPPEIVTRCVRAARMDLPVFNFAGPRREISRPALRHSMVGDSAAMREVFRLIEKAGPTCSTVLITGESGTGKELVARALHDASPARAGPFLTLNCAAISEHLLESELFGHLRGSFTGAHADREGYFEAADGGTLFLDEISEMPIGLQPKLLRAIERREVTRVGGTRPVLVDVRVIASSNRSFRSACAEGKFREDLYYRLRVVQVSIPPLRARREDIPLLIDHAVRRGNERLKRAFRTVAPDALRLLMSYPWPGNVRELENAIEHALVVGRGDVVEARDLPVEVIAADPVLADSDDLRTVVRLFEAEHIRHVLNSCAGNREAAARRLGIDPSTLYRKMNLEAATPVAETGAPGRPGLERIA
ncbi:MAG: sigma-54-dependent Fis family transcriptional regulator [Planctomycetes bacterium]|nr:sigma-54-dependent Fis family transcriptional regulator [Planctomycetota bacterium]